MKYISGLFASLLVAVSSGAVAAPTGNVNVVGNTDNPSDVDVFAYNLNSAAGNDPTITTGQDRVMVRLSSANHYVQVLTAYNATTKAETWTNLASGNAIPTAVFATPGTTAYFRVVNIAATNDPSVQYTLTLSNPPNTNINSSIVSNDGLSYTPWTFFGIEARTSITFSGTMVDQYGAIVPYSPQYLSLRHASGTTEMLIQTNASGWYNQTLTFPRCTGGGMILGAASNTPTPLTYNYPERDPVPWYNYYSSAPWYSAWPMLDSIPSFSDPFGFAPQGPSAGQIQNGAFGFNQDCN